VGIIPYTNRGYRHPREWQPNLCFRGLSTVPTGFEKSYSNLGENPTRSYYRKGSQCWILGGRHRIQSKTNTEW